MRVRVYPADRQACGHYRLIWPTQVLQAQGYDIELNMPDSRGSLDLIVVGDEVREVRLPEDTDVVVVQRVTNLYMAQMVPLLRERGIAVVVDVDDDLRRLHPSHAAWAGLHPRQASRSAQSWRYLADACRAATLVTATTPALLHAYAKPGQGALLPNYLPEHMYDTEPRDRTEPVRRIGWPATLASHPDDPAATGGGLRRVLQTDPELRLHTVGERDPVAAAFGVASWQVTARRALTTLEDYPAMLAELDIGLAPLAPTAFNDAKSWLTPLAMSAVGLPWVGSPTPEYQRLHDLGCGLLAAKPKEWYRQVSTLIRDPHLRVELAAAGRAVAAGLRLADHAWRWWDAWEQAMSLERS